MTPIGSLELGRFPNNRAYASPAPLHQLTPDPLENLGFIWGSTSCDLRRPTTLVRADLVNPDESGQFIDSPVQAYMTDGVPYREWHDSDIDTLQTKTMSRCDGRGVAILVAGSPEEDSEAPIIRWLPWEAEESSLNDLWHRRLIFRPDEVTKQQRASSFRPQRFSSRRTGRSGRALGPCPFFR